MSLAAVPVSIGAWGPTWRKPLLRHNPGNGDHTYDDDDDAASAQEGIIKRDQEAVEKVNLTVGETPSSLAKKRAKKLAKFIIT